MLHGASLMKDARCDRLAMGLVGRVGSHKVLDTSRGNQNLDKDQDTLTPSQRHHGKDEDTVRPGATVLGGPDIITQTKCDILTRTRLSQEQEEQYLSTV